MQTGLCTATVDARGLSALRHSSYGADSEPDLLWASCGGGGGTVGIVTKFTYRLTALPNGGRLSAVTVRGPTMPLLCGALGSAGSRHADAWAGGCPLRSCACKTAAIARMCRTD